MSAMTEDVFEYLTQRGVLGYMRRLYVGGCRPRWMTFDMADRLIRLVDTAKTTPGLLPDANAEGGALRRRVARRAGLYAVGRKGADVLCADSLRLLEAAGLVEPGSIDPASLPNEQMERASEAEARAIDARIAQSL